MHIYTEQCVTVCEFFLFVTSSCKNHYYQPMWTLVGGGVKTLEQSRRSMASVMPKKATWLKTSVEGFDPEKCTVSTTNGEKIGYKYLIIATGLSVNFDKVRHTGTKCECIPQVVQWV